MPQTLAATTKLKDSITGETVIQKLGTVSIASAKEHDLKAGMTIKQGKVAFQPGVSKSMVEAAFAKANEYLETVRQSTSEDQELPLASALHDITHTEENQHYQGKRKASVAFAAFPERVIEQLKELQFTKLTVVGTHFSSNEYLGRQWQGEKVPISIQQQPHPTDHNRIERFVFVEGKQLAMFRSESPQLPTGTEALATITSPPSASAIATSSKGNQLKITQIQKHDFAGYSWNSDSVNVTIGFKSNSNGRRSPTPIALVDGKVLGAIALESFAALKEKLTATGVPVQGFQFTATLKDNPATIAHIVVDPRTVRYPEKWTQDSHRTTSAPERITPQTTSEQITQLAPNQVFVFGSNEAGWHGKGSALTAFGQEAARVPGTKGKWAVFAQGRGYQEGTEGASYAIATKDLSKGKRSIPLEEIGRQVDAFLEFAQNHLEKEFLVTKLGTGLAGYTTEEMAGLFADKSIPNNVVLPQEFVRYLEQHNRSARAIPLEPKSLLRESKNPLDGLTPINSAVAARMTKDIAMAEVATQFIGISAAPPDTPSSTRNYQKAWGDRANTGEYSTNDTIMVSGSGPWRGVSEEKIKEVFAQQYIPLLERAVAAGASFVVGDAKGTDRLVQQFLAENGYQFERKDGFVQCIPENVRVLDTTATLPSTTIRQPWEQKMLNLAFQNLQSSSTNALEEIQTATFAHANFRAIYHAPTETLHIVDENNHRGTLYKAKKGEKATICEFNQDEKEGFLQQSSIQQRKQQERLLSQQSDEPTKLKMKKGIEQGE